MWGHQLAGCCREGLRVLEGTLDGVGLTPVLHELRSGRLSAILHLDHEGTSKRVYFHEGNIVFASSDVGEERLGELLVRDGKLTRDELELACKVRETSTARIGQTLVEMGYVSESELDAHVKAQVEAILRSLLPWQSGFYRAEIIDDSVAADLARRDIPTERILLEAARGLGNTDAMRERIGDLGSALSFGREPTWVGENLELTPEEGFVLSRVDGSSTAREIAALSPMGEDQTLRCICALVVAGVLDVSVADAPSVISPSSPARVSRPPEPARVGSPPASPPRPASPAPPPPQARAASADRFTPAEEQAPKPEPPAPARLDPQAEAFREEMLAKHATAHRVTYYELLEVSPTSTPEDVRSGYLKLAKKLHPDYRAGLKIPDPEGLFDDLFLAVEAAYEVLSNKNERRRYDSSLEMRAASARPLEPERLNVPEEKPKPDSLNHPKMARMYFENGQRYFHEQQFHEAIEQLQNAVRLDDTKAEYHRLLAQSLMKNPHWRRRAEKHFLAVLETDRFDVETMLTLGELYEEGKMELRARRMYEQALSLDPGNEKAIERLGVRPRASTVDKLKNLLNRGKDR